MSNFQGIPLSVLDTVPVWHGSSATESVRGALDLAVAVERLGYRRYWVAEHHNQPGVAATAPAILIGHLAGRTSRLRIGSGGVMLPNHPPLVVAEQFGTLEALYPGRIDLGIGRAPGTDPATARALRRATGPNAAAEFPAHLQELLDYFGLAQAGSGHGGIQALPADENEVPVWVLGSSGESAQLAGRLGAGYAFAHHFNPSATVASLDIYRRSFRPSAQFAQPYAVVAAVGIAADTQEHAEFLAGPLGVAFALSLRGINRPFPSAAMAAEIQVPVSSDEATMMQQVLGPQLIGSPEQLKQQLEALVDATGLDELMLHTMIQDPAERVRSYELFAELLGSASREPAVVAQAAETA
ncbi:luciferase family oxidoreductase, group 1 [Frankia torreyi]|uniref:Luciferase family oxidoreductase, group 1 n=2 Tax=Frankia TaxID=1854 RepID=A0A0D8B9X5_9ACTN|nr:MULTISPECIES: LLM class flavin-dependent oxidoreductase [Frankia]KJE20182.1 luciferase family oxidoreductase, group 1 [Frankia torreyi]KQC34941.1 alkanal monooxygenase [Frankia sp. ACN1ag]